jgi:proteasome lid subunit RPN8/RPN11
MAIWGFRRRRALLRIPSATWGAVVTELGRRGGGWSESGAFLLADRGGDLRRVTRVVYLDDLDPQCLQGGIHFDGRAYSKLWDTCSAEKRVVVGDVHTHPGRCVEQSDLDAANPMVARDGHIALILPGLAIRPISAHEVGVYRYDGNGWQSWAGKAASRRLLIGWSA